MSFNQSSYGVIEDDGTVNIMIVLSQTSSVQFEAMISTTDITAVGTYVCIFYINRLVIMIMFLRI